MNPQLLNAAREVVERSRAGDQVAMAHIVRVREGAKAGVAVLKESEQAIDEYISKHPVPKSTARWGTDVSVNTNPKAQQAVWKARACSPEVFAVIVAKTAPFLRTWDLVAALLHGPLLKADTPLAKTAGIKNSRIGGCVRNARQLQLIATNSNVPISSYCRIAGGELDV